MGSIQGVIFDLDGVITDTAEYHYWAWKKLAEKIGIHIDRKFNEQLKGVSRSESLNRILKYGGQENKYSSKEKEGLTDWKNTEYVKMIQNITSENLLPGIAIFLDELERNNIQTAIASASKNAGTILSALGIKERFNYIVNAANVKKSKPDPEVFIKAYQGLNLAPEVCVGIEDAAFGIDAIHASGMKAVGVGNSEALSKADLLISDTSGLSLEALLNIQ